MKHLSVTAGIALCWALLSSAEPIANVPFTDMDGKQWDLYTELAKGKSVYLLATGYE